MAYRDPKKRQMWLKIWFSSLEEAEEINQEAFEVDEEEDDASHTEDWLLIGGTSNADLFKFDILSDRSLYMSFMALYDLWYVYIKMPNQASETHKD